MNPRIMTKRPTPYKDQCSAEHLKLCSISDLLAGMHGLAIAMETAVDLDENIITAKRLRQLVIELRNRIDPQPLGDGMAGHRSPRRPKPDLMADLQNIREVNREQH